MLLLFWPVGLYLMGRYAPWRERTQTMIKVGIVGMLFGGIGITALAAMVTPDESPTGNGVDTSTRFATATPTPIWQASIPPTRAPIATATPRPTRTPAATRTTRPTRVPDPAPVGRVPGELDVVYENELAGWPRNETNSGSASGQSDGYHIVVNAGAEFGVGQTTGADYANNSASVNVRIVRSTGNALGCLMFRAVANPNSRYDYCIDSSGGVSAYFASPSGFEQVYSGRLSGNATAADWNNLKVLFRDTQIRLFLNGTLIHETHHDGTSEGQIGVIAFNNSAAGDAAFVFRDLVIRDVLINNTAQAPTPTPQRQPTMTPTARPTPTVTPTTTSASRGGIPREGAVLYQRPLSEWRAESYTIGWVEPMSTSLAIGVYGGDGEHTVEVWTDRNDFADISASVEIREVSDGTAAAGCLAVRHDVASGDYQFCILGNGRTWAAHNFVDSSGQWQVEVLLDDAVRQGTRSPSTWNTIKVIASGNRLWFFANDFLAGSTSHDARSVGDIALSVTTWDMNADAEFEFRNLVIRAIQ